MKTRIFDGHSQAHLCRGNTVVIDVLRAFTTTSYLFNSGAVEVAMVKTPEEAFALRKEGGEEWRDAIIVGEDQGIKIEGFDFGNSPYDISQLDLNGRRAILRTMAGTQGVVGAKSAKRLFVASFVIADATVNYLKRLEGDVDFLSTSTDLENEDLLCADYMQKRLVGENLDEGLILEQFHRCEASLRALNPEVEWISPKDLELAGQLRRFSFVIEVKDRDGLLVGQRIDLNS